MVTRIELTAAEEEYCELEAERRGVTVEDLIRWMVSRELARRMQPSDHNGAKTSRPVTRQRRLS